MFSPQIWPGCPSSKSKTFNKCDSFYSKLKDTYIKLLSKKKKNTLNKEKRF